MADEAWLSGGDLLDLGSGDAPASVAAAPAPLVVSPLNDITKMANLKPVRTAVPPGSALHRTLSIESSGKASTVSDGPFPFAPSPVASKPAAAAKFTPSATKMTTSSVAAPVAPVAAAPSPVFKPPSRVAAPAPSPGPEPSPVAASSPVFKPPSRVTAPAPSSSAARHNRRKSLGLDAFSRFEADGGLDDLDLAGGGALDLDDPTADFVFLPAMTPKGKGARAAPAFAPSPVREEPEEEDGPEEAAAAEEEEAATEINKAEVKTEEAPMTAFEPSPIVAAEPDPAMPEPAMPEPAMPEPAMPEPAMPETAMPEPAMPEPAMPAAAADDEFERKLLAAMAAAERGGGLSALGGGVANTPPGVVKAYPAAVDPEPSPIAEPEPDTELAPEPVTENAAAEEVEAAAPAAPVDDEFERKLLAAMAAAEQGVVYPRWAEESPTRPRAWSRRTLPRLKAPQRRRRLKSRRR